MSFLCQNTLNTWLCALSAFFFMVKKVAVVSKSFIFAPQN